MRPDKRRILINPLSIDDQQRNQTILNLWRAEETDRQKSRRVRNDAYRCRVEAERSTLAEELWLDERQAFYSFLRQVTVIDSSELFLSCQIAFYIVAKDAAFSFSRNGAERRNEGLFVVKTLLLDGRPCRILFDGLIVVKTDFKFA